MIYYQKFHRFKDCKDSSRIIELNTCSTACTDLVNFLEFELAAVVPRRRIFALALEKSYLRKKLRILMIEGVDYQGL